ncbi:hypothetical protein N325_08970 [Colius striatus]|uniref:Uncharacterized protein n=1 Tax=Colius striatus TaxID=57412 RepID=A0A091KE47_COLST|nr:hypothetical protein N325_08970 [Colius striatus]
MSEEDYYSLNVKRSLRKKMVKHSTPVDSLLSRTMPSLPDLANQSVKDQGDSRRVYGSPVPKLDPSRLLAQVSSVSVEARFPPVTPTRLSRALDSQESSKETTQSSRVVFSRKRLSTVLASESNEEPSDEVVPNVEAEAPTKPVEKAAVTAQSGPSGLVTGLPGIKDDQITKKRKKKIDRDLLLRKRGEWLIQRFIALGEAADHELTIEEA